MQRKLRRWHTRTALGAAMLAVLALTGTPTAVAATTPSGWSPANLQSAYSLPTGISTTETVAVVTAYDSPDAESDLGTYRTQYGLASCTTSNGCFKKVNQTGGTTYPSSAAGWTVPAAESLDTISAACPECHIILVEANSSAISDLGTAENEAVSLGAKFIDNDWAIPEAEVGSAETTYDTEYFNHPGVAITAPAGDSGYGVNYPAASPYVIAVGGTVLTQNTSVSRGWTEAAWSDTGSGCSAYEPKPSWQTNTACSGRMLNDVSAVATGVAYYDTTTTGGWGTGSGTAISAAIVAATYALAGPPSYGTYPASYLYTHPGALYDITSGSNGTCTTTALCTAEGGWDGPTGQGTPYGINAFHTSGPRPAAVTATNGTTWVFAKDSSGSVVADSLPAAGTTWSGLTSLGGTWSFYPAALATSDGSVWVFAIDGTGTGGNLYADQLPSGSTTWSGWTKIGSTGTEELTGTPTAVQDHSGEIHVLTRGASTGNAYETVLPSGSTTWSALSNLGGVRPDDMSAVVGGGGFITLVGIAKGSGLWRDTLPPGGSWSGWNRVSADGTVTGATTIGQDSAGTNRAWVRSATNEALMETDEPSGTTTWSSLTSRGGTWPSDAASCVGGGGTIWLFDIGLTTDVYKNTLPNGGTTWSGWSSVGGGFIGVPAFEQDDSGYFHLFAVNSSGALETNRTASGTTTWDGWTTLGGSLAPS